MRKKQDGLTFDKLQEIRKAREERKVYFSKEERTKRAMNFLQTELRAIRRAKELIPLVEDIILRAAAKDDTVCFIDFPNETARSIQLLTLIFKNRGFSTRYVNLLHPVLDGEGHEVQPGRPVNRFHTLLDLPG